MIVTGHDQITHIVPEEHAIQNHQRAARIISESLARMEELLTTQGTWTKEERQDFRVLSGWLPYFEVYNIAMAGPAR